MGIRRGSISTPIIADGLVYNLDAVNRASYVPDSTSTRNTLNLTQTGSFISDPEFITQPTSASCWSFDGIDDGINLGSDNPTIAPDTALTFNIWFKIGGAAGSRAYGVIISNWNGTLYCFIGTDINNPDDIIVYLNNIHVFTFDNQPFQTWKMMTITHDGTNIIGYIDGVQTDSSSPGSLATISTGDTSIGYDVNRSNYPFLGEIASLQIYNRALSANEVLHNYNALKGRFA